MVKRADIKRLQKIKKKNSEPVNARKVSMLNQDLEETPVFEDTGIFDSDDLHSVNDNIIAANAKPSAAVQSSYRSKAAKRSGAGRTGIIKTSSIFTPFKKIVNSVFGKKSSSNAALDFAMNHKRRSKREKRRRMIFIYGGVGLAAAAVILVVLLSSGSAQPAGPAQTFQQAAAIDNISAGKIGDAQTLKSKPLGAKMPELMTFTAAFPDDFEYNPPVDTSGLASDPIESGSVVTETATPTLPIETTVPDPTPPPVLVDDLIEYYIVEADKYYNDYGYSTNHYEYTQKEFNALASIIYYEARGEGINGMVAVANVVMNRVLCRGAWPNDIISVLSAPGQFSPWRKYEEGGTPSGSNWSNAKRAARAVLDKEVWVIPQDVYFFRSAYRYKDLKGKDWGSHKYYGEYKGHFYYRHRYSGRKRNGDVPPALFDRVYKYPQYGCKPAKRVYRIQYMLNKLGYDVKADSYFGITTKEALIEFQKKHGLRADGIAGPDTLKKLIKKFGVENYYDKFLK